MFFLTPICLFLLAVAVGILLYPSLMKRRFASRVKEARPNDSEA
jgi:cyanate permease